MLTNDTVIEYISDFMRESNRIEGIHSISGKEIEATLKFLEIGAVAISDLQELLSVYQPNAVLRDKSHLNVRVGNHRPPRGGQLVADTLKLILEESETSIDPYQVHVDYEMLHPFTDGNGRTGRALWLRMMYQLRGLPKLGFLHLWYYQNLDAARKYQAMRGAMELFGEMHDD